MSKELVIDTQCASGTCNHGSQETYDHDDHHGHNHGGRFPLYFLIPGIALLIFAVLSRTYYPSLSLIAFLASYLFIGGDIVLQAGKNILQGKVFDENFLMALATIGAILIGEYPEAVSVMLFYKVGEAFQDRAVDNSKNSIRALMDIKPDIANMLIEGQEVELDPALVPVGSLILVKPGERIPIDGSIIEGSSSLDTSALTGESLLQDVGPGSEVLSGSVNTSGLLRIETSKTFNQSTASKIIEMVQHAGNKKAETEKFISKFASYYTPAVVFMALAIAFIPPYLLQMGAFNEWLYKALVFLVISCPCALVISIPLGFFAGIGAASKRGILVKGGNYLEALDQVHTVVVDKTGTLTEGVFKLREILPEKNFTIEEVHEFAALAESHSSHPIALSIRESYEGKLDINDIEKYEEIAGQGISALIKGRKIHLGSEKLIDSQGLEAISGRSLEREPGVAGVYLWIDKIFAGQIILSDKIRKESYGLLEGLKKAGVKDFIMLTGDEEATAKSVASQLGIKNVFANLMPQDKLDLLEKNLAQRGKNEKVIFIGDGINDAPVLARADVGIAMGGIGSDAAVEAADIVFMRDNPASLIEAIEVSRDTKRVVWQNIILALGVKTLVMLLGVLGLAGMWEAVFADVGVALLAILNSVRILAKYR